MSEEEFELGEHKDEEEEEEETQDDERHQILEENKVWRKNAQLMYDWVSTYQLEWPSLSVQWLPEVTKSSFRDDYESHHMILGTMTDGIEPNYLMVAEVDIPSVDAEVDMRAKPDGSDALSDRWNKVPTIRKRILHEGEVNRCRYMPQNSNIIATKSPSSTVFVFDTDKHGEYASGINPNPQHRCLGHTSEGYGLSWSPHKTGLLLSGSMDASICVWDLSQSGLGIDVQPLMHIPNAHKGPVEDVDWHKTYEFLFGSAGDDRNVYLWDERQNSKTPSNILEKAHASDVHCISFNARSEFLLATGGADKTVKMWDLRKLREMVHCFEGHKGDVQALCWSPFEATKLASSGTDRRVILWDMEKIGSEQDAEDAADGAPELMFAHGGHSATVSDLSWNLNQQHVFASVDNDNMLHIWQPANVDDDEPTDDIDDEALEEQPSKKQKA